MSTEKVTLEVDVKGSGSGKKTIGDLKRELKSASDSAKQTGENLAQGIKKAGQPAISLKTQLRNLKDELVTLDEGSAEFQNMAIQAAKLEDQIADVNNRVKFLASDTKRLDTLVQAGQGIAGSFQAAQGAMALFGKDSAEVQKAIQKIIAVQGIMNGVMAVTRVLNKDSVLGNVLRIKALKQWALQTKVVTVVQRAFNWVLRANPIGLIITAIALLIGGLVLLAKNIGSVGDFFKDLGVKVKDIIDGFGVWKNVILILLGPIGLLIAAWDFFFGEQAAKLSEQQKREQEAFEERTRQGKILSKQHKARLAEIEELAKAEQDAFDNRQEIFDIDIKRLEAEGKNSNLLKRAKITDQLEHEQFVLESINKQIASWRQYYEDLFVLSGKSREDFKEQMKGQGIDLDALQAEALEVLEEQNKKIFQAETNLIAFERGLREKNNKEKIVEKDDTDAKLLAAEKKRLAEEQKAFNNFLARKEKLENEFLDKKLTQEQRELNAVEDKYFMLIEQAEIFGEDSVLLEEARLEALAEVRQKFADQEQEEKRKNTQANTEMVIGAAENVLSSLESIASLGNKNDLKRIKAKQAAGERLTASEKKRLDKEAKIQKAFAVAQIAIDTARGIAAAVAAGAGVPFPGNIPAIISGVAAVLSNVAAANKVLGESLPSASAAGGGDATEQTVNADSQSQPSINPLQEGSTLLNEPTKVVVLESDITNTQNNVSVIEQEATF